MLSLTVFKITAVMRIDKETVQVNVRIDAKAWTKAKRDNALGALYGIDISNQAYRDYGVKASNPTVSDKDNASGGIKYLILYYADATWKPAPDNVIHVDFINKKRVAA